MCSASTVWILMTQSRVNQSYKFIGLHIDLLRSDGHEVSWSKSWIMIQWLSDCMSHEYDVTSSAHALTERTRHECMHAAHVQWYLSVHYLAISISIALYTCNWVRCNAWIQIDWSDRWWSLHVHHFMSPHDIYSWYAHDDACTNHWQWIMAWIPTWKHA